MIAYLKGKKIASDLDSVVLDVNGVGYEIHCSQIALANFELADELELLIYTAVREDAITLYGFQTALEKQLFLTLIKVNGIGPKMAMTMLSGAPVERIFELIESEDVKGLTQLPKVGKKTAEQLILSLKGKLPKLETSTDAKPKKLGGTRSEVVSALVNLGFRLNDVERVVTEMRPDIEIEDGVRRGLQLLTQV